MHMMEGDLRAYVDGELPAPERERVARHLAECPDCRVNLQNIDARARSVGQRLGYLLPSEPVPADHMTAVRARLEARWLDKENLSMLKKWFAPRYRPVLAGLAVLLLMIAVLAVPSVRAVANNFLGLFRVQQIAVVEVNPANLPEQLGSSSLLEELLSENVQVEEFGEPQMVADQAEASALAGLQVRLPDGMKGSPDLRVQNGSRTTFDVDLARVRTLLQELGYSDIELPDSLEGAKVTLTVNPGVLAGYGNCNLMKEEASEMERPRRQSDCVLLMQMASPTVDAPPGLNLPKVGTAFLQVMGMSREEAEKFSQTVDWTTTLVVPIPRYGVTTEDVTVDGVLGTLFIQDLEHQLPNYMLVWIKDGVLYTLTGPGLGRDAIRIANSMP